MYFWESCTYGIEFLVLFCEPESFRHKISMLQMCAFISFPKAVMHAYLIAKPLLTGNEHLKYIPTHKTWHKILVFLFLWVYFPHMPYCDIFYLVFKKEETEKPPG